MKQSEEEMEKQANAIFPLMQMIDITGQSIKDGRREGVTQTTDTIDISRVDQMSPHSGPKSGKKRKVNSPDRLASPTKKSDDRPMSGLKSPKKS